MSVTLHVRMPTGETYAVDIDGNDTVRGLYTRVGGAVGVADGTFELRYEGAVLRGLGMDSDIGGSGLCEGSEVGFVIRDPMCVHNTELDDAKVHERVKMALEEDPEGVFIVDVSGVGDELCMGKIPEGVRHLRLVCDSPNEVPIKKVSDGFLKGVQSLLSVDLSPLCCVEAVGDEFMSGCSRLTTLDLSPLCNVETIGGAFLKGLGCTHIDLTPLSKVAEVGEGFLKDSSAATVSWSQPSDIEVVPDCCFCGCTALVSIDLTGLSNATVIYGTFLCRSLSLQSLDLKPLGRVESIGGEFLGRTGCPTIDLAPLCNVAWIGWGLMQYALSTSITWSHPSKLTVIPDYCFFSCSALRTVDLQGLSNVTFVGKWFLSDCTALQSVDLSPLRHAATLDRYFLRGTPIACADLTQFTQVDSIDGTDMLTKCSEVRVAHGSVFEKELRGLPLVVVRKRKVSEES